MDEWEVFPRVAAATAMKAQEEGVARLVKSAEQVYQEARAMIQRARDATHVLMREGIIPPAPERT
jgi:malate dehydrogenase (oxaloacetate-decarboxylating)